MLFFVVVFSFDWLCCIDCVFMLCFWVLGLLACVGVLWIGSEFVVFSCLCFLVLCLMGVTLDCIGMFWRWGFDWFFIWSVCGAYSVCLMFQGSVVFGLVFFFISFQFGGLPVYLWVVCG